LGLFVSPAQVYEKTLILYDSHAAFSQRRSTIRSKSVAFLAILLFKENFTSS